MSYINLLADDKNVIIYRPKMTKITGDVVSTILLMQILYWRGKMEGNFHKPLSVGDANTTSFADELGITKKSLTRAAKNLQTRGLIRFWTQKLAHKTWWEVNTEKLDAAMAIAYPHEVPKGNFGK